MSVEHRLANTQQGRGLRTVAAAFLAIAAGACSLSTPVAQNQEHRSGPAADLVIVNARIWTGVDREASTGRGDEPTALAVASDKIVAVGTDSAIRAWMGNGTEVIDAGGHRVIPGITDSHAHIISGGHQLDRLYLRNARNREEFMVAIATDVRTKKKGQWVLGGRWSVDSWTAPSPPHKTWIDPIAPDVPIFLTRMDGHSALVNSAALRLAGIDAAGPPDPEGGEIERDPKTGEPTGILKESAMGLVRQHIPDPTPNERYEALRRAMRHANSLGITSMHDMFAVGDLEAFSRAEQDGALTVRITVYLGLTNWASNIDKVLAYGLDSDMLRLAGFKGFMDGSLGSRTAYMREPYSDRPADMQYPRGQLTAMADPPESFQQSVALVDSRGLQIAVHAIGDEANHLLLDAYEYALKRNGRRNARYRVEHAQHLHVEDIPRFAKLGVVASMQPFHKADDGRYAKQRLGEERLAGSYAYRQLVDTGALVVFGSDWPVVTLNPFSGIDSAVNARTLAGDIWLPSHSLTVEEALRAYTVSPPKAIHREDRLGTIEVGKLADIVVLSQDVLTLPKDQVGKVKVDQTIVGGKIVYTRSD